eukprot:3247410-Pyramimonas_sp.AAC.1
MIAVDVLHTVCYGPVQRLASAILWRIINVNPWGVTGDAATVLEVSIRHLRNEMANWFEEAGVPHNDRIHDLTVSMLGGVPPGDVSKYCGGSMRFKAHETWVVM